MIVRVKLVVLMLSYYLLATPYVALAEESVAIQSPENNSSSFHRVSGPVELGLGLSIPDINAGTESNFLVGYEWIASDNWHIGNHIQYMSGGDIDSTGLYITARPELTWLRWLQFKAGLVSDSYSANIKQQMGSGGIGSAVGVGMVAGFENVELHLLDVEQRSVAGHTYSIVTINIFVLFGALF